LIYSRLFLSAAPGKIATSFFMTSEAELPHLHRALDLSKRGDIVIWTNRLPTQYLEGYET